MSDFIHPRKCAARAGFYPYRATFLSSSLSPSSNDEEDCDYAQVEGLVNLPAAFEIAIGGAGGDFEREAPSSDRLLLNEYFGAIRKGMRVSISLGAWSKEFSVSDVEPVGFGTQTMISLEPIL